MNTEQKEEFKKIKKDTEVFFEDMKYRIWNLCNEIESHKESSVISYIVDRINLVEEQIKDVNDLFVEKED